MKIILSGITNKENLKLIDKFLSSQFTINKIYDESSFEDYFDMIILDINYLNKYNKQIIKIKERKSFIPILLLLSFGSNYNDFILFNTYLDEIIMLPVPKWELKFRINKLVNLSITKESEIKYKKLLESDNIGICIIENGEIVSHNNFFLEIFRFEEENIKNQKFINLFGPNNGELINKLNYFRSSETLNKQFDQKVIINGSEKTLNIRLSLIGESKSILMIILDITDNIKTLEEIEFLNKHDKLTGLYNRAFLDYYLEDIDNEQNLPMSIIMGDIDGLKIINDGFGHMKGDEALINAGNKILKSCRKSDKVFRVGGDEFLIILPNTNEEAAINVVNRINKSITYNKTLNYSISLGLITKQYDYENIQNLIIEAENRMYQNKLINDESHRHSIISSLEKVLQENTNETYDHAERMKILADKMVKKLGLDVNKAHELNLLARLHDIGKVAVPENILNKPGKLTEEEWEIIKGHPAAGFRITKAIPNLAIVAYDILCHHENWDGSGYPQGLKGDQIPIGARIISIVDSYDVMTHKRSYKEAFPREKAIKELKRCSGTQFEPELIKIFLTII